MVGGLGRLAEVGRRKQIDSLFNNRVEWDGCREAVVHVIQILGFPGSSPGPPIPNFAMRARR
jgi:hypothetical protein